MSASALDPFPDRRSYVAAALSAFVRLPDTPNRPCRDDRFFAASLHRDRVLPRLLYDAFLLATARRTVPRHILPDAPAYAPIRLMRYFAPLIAEIKADSSLIDPSSLAFLQLRCTRADRRLPSFEDLFPPTLAPRTLRRRSIRQLSLPFE